MGIVRCFALVMLFLVFSCKENDQVMDGRVPDCGVNPYELKDSPYAEGNNLTIKLRIVRTSNKVGYSEISEYNKLESILNSHYENLGFKFDVMEVHTLDDPSVVEEGMNMYVKHASAYANMDYINVFVYPDDRRINFSGAAVDIPSHSFCVKEKYLCSSTASHEIGHCLGLYHTHTKGKGQGWTTGDFVCGTLNAESLFSTTRYGYIGYVSSDCRYTGRLGDLSQDEHDENISNVMSYSKPECRDKFHLDQGKRMRFIIRNSENHKRVVR